MEEINNQTTDEHFKLFQQEAKKWLERFGMAGWSVHFDHGNFVGDDALAEVSYRMIGRVATISLAKVWKGCEITDHQLRKTAFHEVCELLLARFNVLAKDRYLADPQQIDEEIHNIVRTLESAVFEKESP